MEWTRSETIGLASASCVFCRGLGLRRTPVRGKEKPCGCVFRAIFRACFTRYRHCCGKAGVTSTLTLDTVQGPRGYRTWGRRNEEYIADFELVCKRTLDQEEYEVFEWHFLKGADWKVCIEKIGLDKGTFFHRVYIVQEKLGRVFRELQPHSLFPLDEYFGGAPVRKVVAIRTEGGEQRRLVEEDRTVVARTNVIEMPRGNDRVSRRFPLRGKEPKAA
jgi:hypothetical protein